MSHRSAAALALGIALVLAAPVSTRAQEIAVREGEESPRTKLLMIPYVFYNDTIGLSVGATMGKQGFPQEQSSLWGSAVLADSGTRFMFLALSDLQIKKLDRLFIGGFLAGGSFSEIDVYTDGNPDFPNEIAGDNDSSAHNFIQGEGDNLAAAVRLDFLLPLGDARKQARRNVYLRNGEVVSGGRNPVRWAPATSGFTFVSLNPFYREQTTDDEGGGSTDQVTAGLGLAFRYDNSDFWRNPTRGSRQRLAVSRDWGGFGSTTPWTTVELEWSKYIPFGATQKARQRVLALNAWTIDTPTWDSSHFENGVEIFHRPPSYAGASLGGLRLMRGYPEGRYNSRSAIYYAGEYRYTPRFNPLKDSSFLKKLRAYVDWFQVVGFLEVGRVNDEYDLGELHKDMKLSGGAGVRVFANHLVVRAEMAFSEEDTKFVMSINHPF